MAACCYCNRPLTAIEQRSGQHCSQLRCRERFFQSQLEGFRDDAAARVDEPHPRRFRIIVISHRVEPVVPVDAGQRLALERHLLELARMCAGHHPAAASSETNDPSAPAPTICASCQGWCCYNGGRHSAFLDEETIERFAGQHPDFVADQIVDAYLRYVPETHYEGSCIFHTSEGCRLPRGMRASICNAYECRGLRAAREQRMGVGDPLFIVACRAHEIVQGTFVDESGAPVAVPL